MISVRKALLEDASAVSRLSAETKGEAWSETSVRETIESTYAVVFVAVLPDAQTENREVVGEAIFYLVADEAELVSFVVKKSLRRQGIGSALLRAMFCFLEEQGAARLSLEVRCTNVPALAAYASVGFQMAGRRRDFYQSPVEDAIVMIHSFG